MVEQTQNPSIRAFSGSIRDGYKPAPRSVGRRLLRVSYGEPILSRLRKMRVRATASSLLIAVLFCLSAAIPTWAQQEAEWTWKDGAGDVRSRADLDEILKQHKLWLESGQKSGARADLGYADLHGSDLIWRGPQPRGPEALGSESRGPDRRAPSPCPTERGRPYGRGPARCAPARGRYAQRPAEPRGPGQCEPNRRVTHFCGFGRRGPQRRAT